MSRTEKVTKYYTCLEAMQKKFDSMERPYRFTANTKNEYKEWKEKTHKKLTELIGLDKMDRCIFDAETLESVKLDNGITREKVVIQTEPGVYMPMYILIPAKENQKYAKRTGKPLCFIALPGHGAGGKESVAGRLDVPAIAERVEKGADYGMQLAKNGIIAICPDCRGFGERREKAMQSEEESKYLGGSCYQLAHMAEGLGETVVGMYVWDVMRLVDYIEAREEFDMSELGCIGFSGGGMQTLWAAALDERIKRCIISGYLYGYKDSLLELNGNCNCNYVPHLWENLDMGDIAAMLAPRHLMVQSGTVDHLNGPRGLANVYEQLDIVKSAYKIWNAEGRIFHDVCEGPHAWYPENLSVFLDKSADHCTVDEVEKNNKAAIVAGDKKEEFKQSIKDYAKMLFRRELDELDAQQQYQVVAYAVKDIIMEEWFTSSERVKEQNSKIVYYMSMEFLTGRALGNNIINLCEDKMVREALKELDFDLNLIEDQEPDQALGNGGLGRLAACFLDSLSTLGYAACGCGIRYNYGMFKQKIENGYQIEAPDNWLQNGNPFEMKRPEHAKEVKFGGYVRVVRDENGKEKFVQEDCQSVLAVPYDIPVVGYGNRIINTLRIWSAEAIQSFNLASFDKGDYYKAVEQQNLAKTICEVLYPNDNHYAGKELRLKQQYFFVSATVQRAIEKYLESNDDLMKLPEKVAFQMNDTHPTVAVAELMRVLMDEYGLNWNDAWDITTKSCAYTNHTIMSEALEKWPIELFSKLLPRVYQIVDEINRRFVNFLREKYNNDENKIASMAILYNGQVRMANLAIVAGYSVNGVAALHTEILKQQQLRDFYELWPEKFNNKTNGITQRRFLLHGNPLLAEWVTERIGGNWAVSLSEMEKLVPYADDKEALKDIMDIKRKNKLRLAAYIKEHNNIDVDPDSIFDVQVKRLHEYKRQLLNILHVMYLYNQLKANPTMDFHKRTFIFGAKASAGYRRAKAIIKLINSVADVVNNDPSINDKIKVVFIENYRVSNAEIIFAAADVSEQISTASKEASGTGNMKFMLNGAITLGTMDGANVEIVQEVGMENAVIFGLSSDEVISYENNGGYNPREIYDKDADIKKVLDQLIDGTYSENREEFKELYSSLLDNYGGVADQYFILKDFRSYAEAQKRVEDMYKDRERWAKASLLNTARSGKFSSDRTIEEYVRDIWHLEKVD